VVRMGLVMLSEPRNPSCLLLCLALLAGCGGGGDGNAAERTAAPLPACAGANREIPRPELLPQDFPLPPGTKLTTGRTPFEGQAVIEGAVPGGLDDAAEFFDDELEDAGYAAGRRDSEPGEVESLFTGKSLRGGWRVNDIPNCDGASKLTLVLIRL
jgi:hypothetical protein